MKKLSLIFILIWMLTACSPRERSLQQPVLPNEDSPSAPVDMTPAQRAAISALARTLNLPPEEIALISAESVEWPNGCLGVQKMGVMCTQAIVPGYKIVLEADGKRYEFHTDEDGSQVAQVNDVSVSTPAEETLVKQLASNLGLKESEISVVSSSDVEFGDACLGVAMPDVMCAQVVTPGRIVVLESNGVQYEYHTNEDGSIVQPATLALTWTRDGGIAGFCDRLTVFLSGEVYGNQCGSQPNGTAGTFTALLSKEEREQFNAWMKELGQVNVDASDPKGVSDRMVVTLEFYGKGDGSLTKADEQALILWAQDVFQKLNLQ